MHRLFSRILSLGLLVGLVLASLPPPSAFAIGSSVVVNTNLDEVTNNSTCSLREALQALFVPLNDDCGNLSSPLVITFAPSVTTIRLTQGDVLPNITTNKIVTVTGPVIIDGRETGKPDYGSFVLFDVKSGGILNVANMTFTKAFRAINADSGAVINIAGVSFLDNKSTYGGAIYATGADTKVNIAGSLFTTNQATDAGSSGGGAIYTGGISNLNIGGTIFTGNISKLSGGAIYTGAKNVNITDVIFNGNIANADDGDDDAYDYGGGAIFYSTALSDPKMTITRTIFNGNISTKGSGGAIMINSDSDVAEIRSSSFNGNLAGIPGDETAGGAIYNRGKLTIAQSTILNNAVVGSGGGIANDRRAELTLVNSSVIANAATSEGGGLFNKTTQQGSSIYPYAKVLNTTFALNVAGPAGGQGGGMINHADPEKLEVGNTIVTGSDGAALGGNCVAALTSLGNNLDSGTSCGFTQPGDLQNANANLEAPFFNGGPLSTLLSMKPLSGSAAIDAGSNALCADPAVNNEDQAGRSRPKDGSGNGVSGCDIGALENDAVFAGFGSIPIAPGPVSIGTAVVNTTTNGQFEVFNPGDAKLTVSSGTLSGANPGDFQVTTAFPFDVQPDDPNKVIEITCTPSAVGARTAKLTLATNAPGSASVDFTLVCNGVAQPTPGFGSTPIAPGPIQFGGVNIGSSKVYTISVQETGDATLTVNNLQLGGENPGDFSIPPALTLNILNGGADQNILVTCTPTTTGPRIATLTLTTNDPTKPTVVFNLTCTGRIPPTPPLSEPGTPTVDIGGAGIGPYGLAISPDGKHVYSADDGDSVASRFTTDGPNGTFNASILNYTDGSGSIQDLKGAWRTLVSPDGKYVYVAAGSNWYSGSDSAITVFTRTVSTGALTYASRIKEGDTYGLGLCFGFPPVCQPPPQLNALDGVFGMAISPDGNFFYAGSVTDDTILGLRRDPESGSISLGALKFPATSYKDTTQLNAVYDVAISPDGANLYAAGYTSDSLAVFERNAVSGVITRTQTLRVADAPGLNGVFRIDISSDGNFVYTAGYDSKSVSVFRRNAIDGTLTLVETHTDGVNGVDGIDNASSVRVSPDGRYLYATGENDDAVAVFERDVVTGELVFAQAIKRNGSGQPPLNGARDVVVNPNGRVIYVTGRLDNKVVAIPFANPRPELTALLPSSAKAGSAAFELTVTGKNFVSDSVIRWAGVDLATTFVSEGELRAAISADKIVNPGQVNVTVFNPAPGGGESNTLKFTVTEPDKNPIPGLRELIPNSAVAGDQAFVLRVRGVDFINGAKVRWNGSDRPTTFISDEIVEATISADDIAVPDLIAVTVENPGPGGGISNALPFEITPPYENPRPYIKQLIPASALAGTATPIEMVIQGGNFVEGAIAQWNGENRPTQFVSPTEVRMSVNAADLLNPGIATVVVVNPAPGGGESNTLPFTISAPGDNPVPGVAGIAVTGADGGKLTLTITGSGFANGATVIWNGKVLTPSSINSTQIVVQVDITDFRSAVVSVVNPGPGGGSSTGLLISIVRSYIPFSVKP